MAGVTAGGAMVAGGTMVAGGAMVAVASGVLSRHRLSGARLVAGIVAVVVAT